MRKQIVALAVKNCTETDFLMQGRELCLNLRSILHHGVSVNELGNVVI